MGGIASYIVNLAKHLKKRGDTLFVASSGGDMVDQLTKAGITHIKLNLKTKSELSPKLILALPKLLSLVREKDIQVIHAHTRVTQVLACIASRLSHISYVATCHGFFNLRIGRRIFKCWGDKTIAISDAVKKHLIDDFKVSPADIALIYNGVEIERFKREFDEEERDSLKRELDLIDKTVIGAIGRLSPVKGYRYLIEAFKILLDKDRDLRLLIVGDGPEKEDLKDYCKRLGIEESVTFAALRIDTPHLFSIMDVFVASSVQEGLGLSIAEALAAKKPVVASDIGGISSLIRDNETGLLVKPRDSKALAEKISSLLEDSNLGNRLKMNGCRLVERKFTMDGMADKVQKVYKDLIERRPEGMDRILIVNVNWLGDALFTTPFIKAIRKKFPTSFLACMVEPRCKEILEDNPYLNEIIIYDEKAQHKSIIGKLRLIKALRQKGFDAAFILHRSLTKALIAFLSGIRVRIGYNTKQRGFLLTKAVEEQDRDVHKVEYFLYLAKNCGAQTGDKDYEFFIKDSERDAVGKFLEEKGVRKDDTLVVLNPGGNWPPKRWPKKHFAKLSDKLSSELKVKTIITGAHKDLRLAKDIMDLSQAKPINACGDTSIKRLGALMERADLVVSSDSGPMHIAMGVKTKVIALFGPTSDSITGPYGSGDYKVIKKDIKCPVPCYNFDCKDYRCMKAITVDEVFQKAKEMLSGKTR